jgi:hypothetical protein
MTSHGVCRSCGVEFEYQHGIGRRRIYCDTCRQHSGQRDDPYRRQAAICAYCGQEFKRPNSNRQTCSVPCETELRKQRAYRGIGPTECECVCQECGKTFMESIRKVARRGRKYCSRQCSWEAKRGPDRSRVPAERTALCEVCGVTFVQKTKAHRLCSDACRSAYNRREYHAKFVSARETNVFLTKVCPECGEPFETNFCATRRRFCSEACASKHTKRNQKDRRRARIKEAGFVEAVGIKTIGKRDGWRCHICGKRVDPKLKAPHPLSASRDHLIPVSAHGEHSKVNMRLAHFRCNSVRGAGGEVQLLLFGEWSSRGAK